MVHVILLEKCKTLLWDEPELTSMYLSARDMDMARVL